jgi:asparagine synthetase B (glutamine-hydrolysing)
VSSSLVRMINASIIPKEKPAVLISGGLDSSILLYHLSAKVSDVHAIHIVLPGNDESKAAKCIADFCGVKYSEVTTSNILATYSQFIPHMDFPRINLWPVFGYHLAEMLECKSIYVAEGLDEHFGGYINKAPLTPQEYWGGVLEWSLPTHRFLANQYSMDLQAPFITLPLCDTIKQWRDPHVVGVPKLMLRKAYQSLLPKYILERPKVPGRINFETPEIWNKEVEPILHQKCPSTHEESVKILQRWATQRWLEG